MTQELSQLGNPVRRRRLAPALRQRVYVPERLRARVTAGLDAGLLQIQAPAGYGKTAVLLQALLDEGIDAQWYTCSSDDADAGHLLRGLVEVLGLAHTVGGQTALAALKTGETRPSYRPLLRPIVEEIGEGDGMHRLLVIDDADVLADAPAALALFDDLVAVLANQVGLVLVSRSELPLGSLAKPRLDGRAARITADDLLLREDEIAECAATAYGIELQGEEIAPLYQATSGWAIALRLALRIRDLSAEFPSRERGLLTPEARADLFAYLAEEVVKRIDASTVEFLRRTAVLETLDPAICARMTGEERPAELIQSLAGAGLPVMKTGWSAYRCHSLLREYFLTKLSADELRDAQAAAGRAYAATGDYGAALALLVAAGDTGLALKLAEAHGAELFAAGRGRQLLELVKNARADDLTEQYHAVYWAAFAASRMFEWDWATNALERVHEAARAHGDDRTAREALRALAYMFNVWGRFAPAAEAAHRLIEAIPATQRAARAAASLGHLVPGMTGSGQFTEALELIRAQLPDLAVEPRADADAEAFARSVAAVTLARAGDFAAAGAQLSLAEALIPGCLDDVVRTQVPWTRAMAGFLGGDPDAAEAAARRTEPLALQFADLQRILECRAMTAMVKLIRGRADEAEQGFLEVEELRAGGTNFWVTILTLLSRPRRLLLAGDGPGALSAAESNHVLAKGVGEGWFVCFSRLEVIYLRMLAGDRAGAVEHALTAVAEADALGADLLRYGSHLLLAAVSEEREERALDVALQIAEARDYRFFMPYAACLPELDAALWHALGGSRNARAAVLLQRSPESAQALRRATALTEAAALRAVALLSTWGARGGPGLKALARSPHASVVHAARAAREALEAANPHHLSEREREVLLLLSEGLRTKDIAERLVLTPATVSTHIQRIMAKTGTSSRAELLALAARELRPAVN